MLNIMITVFTGVWSFAKLIIIPIIFIMLIFFILCLIWYFIIKYKYKMKLAPSGQIRQKRKNILYQLLQVPKRYMLDFFQREEDFFYPKGIHMFCGEQGSGKTMACTEMMMKLQKQYPKSKVISNFALSTEDDELDDWHKLIDYTNGHKGVIVGIDEIQNWFMSGTNKLPEGMLEIATQNRKNNRILCCTAQVFTRVNKGLREQVNIIYNPHTFLGCFTIVIMRKPQFDDEGNVIQMKYRGIYAFVHTDELRNAYDTYKVIHTLSKTGFKEQAVQQNINNNYILIDNKKRKKA